MRTDTLAAPKFLPLLEPVSEIIEFIDDNFCCRSISDQGSETNDCELSEQERKNTQEGTPEEMLQKIVAFCAHGRECGIGCALCEFCEKETILEQFSGYLYVKRESSHVERKWVRLVGKELYGIS